MRELRNVSAVVAKTIPEDLIQLQLFPPDKPDNEDCLPCNQDWESETALKISSALDRLEKRDLVGRRRRPGDRRVVFIELTKAGQRLAAKLRSAHIENRRAMLVGLSLRDREELNRLAGLVALG